MDFLENSAADLNQSNLNEINVRPVGLSPNQVQGDAAIKETDGSITHSSSQDTGFFSDNTPSPDEGKDMIVTPETDSDVVKPPSTPNTDALDEVVSEHVDTGVADTDNFVAKTSNSESDNQDMCHDKSESLGKNSESVICDNVSDNSIFSSDVATSQDKPKSKDSDLPKEETKESDLPKEETKESDLPKEETNNSDLPKEEKEDSDLPKEKTEDSDLPKEETEESDLPKEKTEDRCMDILGNGCLKKKVLVPGKGEGTRPNNGDTVTIKVAGLLEGGAYVDKQDFTFILNDGDVLMAFDLGVALMERGEICELFADSRYAYGSLGRAPDIPANADITYTIELLDIKPYDEAIFASAVDRLKLGEAKRERGNYLYGRQDFSGAINSYSKAVKVMDHPELNADLDPPTLAMMSEAWVKCYNNMAACQLKVDALDAAIRSCEKVLATQADNVKALFRLGKAHGAKNEVDTALAYLRQGIKLDPESKMLHQEMLNLARRKTKETDMTETPLLSLPQKEDSKQNPEKCNVLFSKVLNESEKVMYQKMFGLKPEDSPLGKGNKNEKSNSMMKWALMASTAAAVAASVGLAWYRTG